MVEVACAAAVWVAAAVEQTEERRDEATESLAVDADALPNFSRGVAERVCIARHPAHRLLRDTSTARCHARAIGAAGVYEVGAHRVLQAVVRRSLLTGQTC